MAQSPDNADLPNTATRELLALELGRLLLLVEQMARAEAAGLLALAEAMEGRLQRKARRVLELLALRWEARGASDPWEPSLPPLSYSEARWLARKNGKSA